MDFKHVGTGATKKRSIRRCLEHFTGFLVGIIVSELGITFSLGVLCKTNYFFRFFVFSVHLIVFGLWLDFMSKVLWLECPFFYQFFHRPLPALLICSNIAFFLISFSLFSMHCSEILNTVNRSNKTRPFCIAGRLMWPAQSQKHGCH